MGSQRRIVIVGGGQAGLQLGIGLMREEGYDVEIVQDRDEEEIAQGKVLSSQCMFDAALQNERELELNFWDQTCPTVNSINFTVPAPDGSGAKAIDWNGKLDRPAQSVDQRVKIPAWMAEFTRYGGRLTIHAAGGGDLEHYVEESDLRDRRRRQRRNHRSVRTRRREIAVRQAAARARADLCHRHDAATRTFRRLLQPDPDGRRVFRVSALTTTGPCEIMVFEGIPGGPMDCWRDVRRGRTPRQIELDPRHFSAVGSRAQSVDRAYRRQRHSDGRRRADREAPRRATYRRARS